MRMLVILMFAVIHIYSATTASANAPNTLMVAVEPVPVNMESLKEQLGYKPSDSLPANALDCLPNHTISVTTASFSTNVGIQYLIGSASAKHETLTVTQDYTNFCPVTLNGTNVRIGVGVRVTAYLYTSEAGVDVSNIFNIALSAKMKKLDGYLTFQVLGVTGKGIRPLIPTPAPLTPDSVMNAIMAMAVVKSKIDEGTAVVRPVVLTQEVPVEVVNGRARPLINAPQYYQANLSLRAPQN